MIVKLRQNFMKMREFSMIRDQKKIKLKIFIVYEIWLCSQMRTLAVFDTNFWNQFKELFISIQNNQNNQLHGTFPITWQCLICANTCCILLKIRFNWNYLGGGKVKLWAGTCPTCSPLAMPPIWWGPWWVVSSAPSKLWACVRAHSFQRQYTHINLLRTNILLNKHIVAQECRQKIFQGGGGANTNKSSINY